MAHGGACLRYLPSSFSRFPGEQLFAPRLSGPNLLALTNSQTGMSNWLQQLGDRKRRLHGGQDAPSTKGGAKAPRVQPQMGRPGATDLGDRAIVVYAPGEIEPDDCGHLMEALATEVKWARRTVRIMGKDMPQPRLVAYMADNSSMQYTYSGARFVPAPWHPMVLKIKEEVEKHSEGTRYNSCLLNFYRNGNDCMGWHSDDEPLYGETPTIGSVSLGAQRDFLLRKHADHTKKIAFALNPGDVLVMKGTTQRHWQHCLPKRARVDTPRINLTFRRVLNRP